MQRIDENTYIDDTLVTCAEYQLFIDEMRELGKYYQPDHWTSCQFLLGQARDPILGVRHSDAIAFCEWLNKESRVGFKYRIPHKSEVTELNFETRNGFWIEEEIGHYSISGVTRGCKIDHNIFIDLLKNDLALLEILKQQDEKIKSPPPTSTELLNKSIPLPGSGVMFSFGNSRLVEKAFIKQITNQIKNRYSLKPSDNYFFQEKIHEGNYRLGNIYERYHLITESFGIDPQKLLVFNLGKNNNTYTSIENACKNASNKFEKYDLINSLKDFLEILKQINELEPVKYQILADLNRSANLMAERKWLGYPINSVSSNQQYDVLRWYIRTSAYLFTEQFFSFFRSDMYKDLVIKTINNFADLYLNMLILESMIKDKIPPSGGIRLVKERIK